MSDTTPCECCEFPWSQQHHLFPWDHDNTEMTIRLCPNCNELYTVIYCSLCEFPDDEVRVPGLPGRGMAEWGRDTLDMMLIHPYFKVNKHIISYIHEKAEEAHRLRAYP